MFVWMIGHIYRNNKQAYLIYILNTTGKHSLLQFDKS